MVMKLGITEAERRKEVIMQQMTLIEAEFYNQTWK